jgi:hypothetical protein
LAEARQLPEAFRSFLLVELLAEESLEKAEFEPVISVAVLAVVVLADPQEEPSPSSAKASGVALFAATSVEMLEVSFPF